jgi:hypothetical protein
MRSVSYRKQLKLDGVELTVGGGQTKPDFSSEHKEEKEEKV